MHPSIHSWRDNEKHRVSAARCHPSLNASTACTGTAITEPCSCFSFLNENHASVCSLLAIARAHRKSRQPTHTLLSFEVHAWKLCYTFYCSLLCVYSSEKMFYLYLLLYSITVCPVTYYLHIVGGCFIRKHLQLLTFSISQSYCYYLKATLSTKLEATFGPSKLILIGCTRKRHKS